MGDVKRVCCFCEKWGSGGIESFLLSVFENMDRSGLEIELAAAQLESELYLPRLERCGVPLRVLSGNTRRLAANHAAFRALLRERRYDAVHLNIYHALSLLYARDAARAGVPVRIAHSHNNGLRRSLMRPVKLAVNGASRQALSGYPTALAACSRDAAAFLFPGEAEVEIVPNGIRLDRFAFRQDARRKIREELGLEDRFVLGEVGRLCGQKNQMFLLDVIAALSRAREDAALLLVGEGELRPALEARAEALGVSDRVIFYGTSDDVPGLLSAMDVFALPSLFEGLGIVAVEAQAAGLPVLFSDQITRQAGLTDEVRFLPIDRASPERWADTAAEYARGHAIDRTQGAARVRDAGFTIQDTVRSFLGLYGLGGDNE